VTWPPEPNARNAEPTAPSTVAISSGSRAAHDLLGELIVERGARGPILEVRAEQVEGGDVGSRSPRQDLEQARRDPCAGGEDDQLKVLDWCP